MIIGNGIVMETEPNNNFGSAYDLGNIGPQIQLDSLSLTSGDLDYYRFSLNNGAHITIETDGETGGDTILYLYDSNQNLLNTDDDSGTGYYSKLGYNLAAGTYYVMVEAYSGTVPNYSLEIRKETVIQTEPNESFETAYDLGTVEDESRIDYQSISGSTDLDYYRFTLGKSGFVTVSAEGGDPALALYDADRQLVTEAASGLLALDLEAGTYYVLAHSNGTVNNYDLTVKNYGEIPDLVLEGNYNSPVSTLADVLVKSGTEVNSYYPGGIQLLVSGRTVTVENNISLNCNSIRNAAILFGEDAYWGDGTNAMTLLDGTVTFTGANAALSSKVSNCITAGGIVGNNLTVNFTGAADNSSGITFRATQNTGPGNEAWGIRARGDLTMNGNFGGNITSCFDYSLLSSTRWADTAGLYASGDLVFNGGISGTILTSCYTVDQSDYSSARGLYSGKTLTVTGDISGTVAALAEKTAYSAFAYDRLEISVTGTLFAGRSTAGQTPEQFLTLLNDQAANSDQLKDLSASFNAVYGGAESVVTLKAGAAVWGDIRLGNDSVLTISSEANLYGNADFSTYSNGSNVTFLLEGISETPVVSGSLLEAGYGKASITIDATNALNGQYTLAENWALTNANDFAVKAGAETISRSSAVHSGNKYVFTFGSGMSVEWDSAAGLTLTVSGSPNTEKPDSEAPVLGGNLNALVTDTNVSVTWNAASDNVGVTGYQFRYGNSEALSGEGISVSSNSCHLQDLSNGTYFYQIRAYDAAGNHSNWSEIQSFTVDYTPPVLVPYQVPQAEYMYGCTATVVGMLLGYYDRFGYLGYDVSDLIAGTVELNARGLDGNAYDMDAFDTVLGSAIASPEYVERFYGTAPEQELPYTFIGNTTELNIPVWNCIADYLGTGQYWRGNGDLSTSQYFDTLQNIQNFTFTENRSSGTISRDVPAQYTDSLYGLNLYVRNAGYQLDAANSKSVYTDNNGGSFSFADYKAEIDAGRLVIIHVEGHSMLGYGYDDSSNEIIFDDTYNHDCRMNWGGEYYYSNVSRALKSVSVVQFDTDNLTSFNSVDAPVVSADITAPTNQNVTLTALCDIDDVIIQFSFDNVLWQNYSAPIVMNNNGTVYFRGKDEAGNLSEVTSYAVTNIDKIAPVKPTAGASTTTPTNQNVTVTAAFSEDSAQKQYSLDNSSWQDYGSGVVMQDNGTVYFRGIDEAGNISDTASYEVTNIDKIAPEAPVVSADITSPTNQNVTVSAVFSDDSAVREYSLDGENFLAYGNGVVMEDNGTVYFRGIDAAGNISKAASWTVANICAALPENPEGSASGLRWTTQKNSAYAVEYSTDQFGHAAMLTAESTGLDVWGLPQGTYQWRVCAAGSDLWVQGDDIQIASAVAEPRLHQSAANGYDDVFFARADGKWDSHYAAEHIGTADGWATGEQVSLNGKNRIADIFEGSDDANVLLLTDDAKGDALFIDDIYTGLPETVSEQRARIARIDEIRAGAGDDIVDLTSQRFEYEGSGLTVRGGAGNDTIWANGGDNFLFGDAGNDRLVGASGDDVLIGGIGKDSMHGGGGSDIFTFCENWGNDTVEQLADGEITLWFASGDISKWDAGSLTYADGENSVMVSGITADQVTLIFGDDGSEQYETLSASGAFAEATSEKIFEDKAKGLLA